MDFHGSVELGEGVGDVEGLGLDKFPFVRGYCLLVSFKEVEDALLGCGDACLGFGLGQWLVGLGIVEMVVERALNVSRFLYDGWSEILVCFGDDEGVAREETFEESLLVSE